jgi:hypothetical protein
MAVSVRVVLALALGLWPAMAGADTPMSAAEFDAYTKGKTMTYAQNGEVWGREQYLPNRQVIWAFEGQECKRGTWDEPAPGLICFAYEDDPADLECWRFFADAGRLLAQSEGSDSAQPLAAIEETDAPLACPGPDVGV